MPNFDGPTVSKFIISSFSGGGDCVEIGRLPDGGVIVRDSKDPLRRLSLTFDRGEWESFVRGVKAGEFDF